MEKVRKKKRNKAQKGWDAWVASRPESVRRLIAEFPPMTLIVIDGENHWVMGYNESDQLIISNVDPHINGQYRKAQRAKRYICAHHLREHGITLISSHCSHPNSLSEERIH